MEYISKFFKKTGMQSLITSIIFAIIGIILIINPEGTIKVISYFLGITFILIGVYKTISYFVNKGSYDLYNYDLAFGIIAVVFGIVTMAYSKQISTFFRIVIGMWIVYSSIMRFSLSLSLKALGTKVWGYSLVISIVMLICGIYTIASKGIILVTIGTVILIYSILDIIESIIFLKNIKEL